MFKVKSDFICIFKVGDNINYNLKVLALFYKTDSMIKDGTNVLLYKPIIIIIASICEAILYDFHVRIRCNTREGIRNLGASIINNIRSKKIDEFETYIASAKKCELFGEKDSKIYIDLDELRKLRNRIHIQNKKKYFADDEDIVFTKERKIMAEEILEKIMKEMLGKYSRPNSVTGYVEDFVIPWDEHIK